MATAGQLRELRRKYHLGEFRRDASPTKARKQTSAISHQWPSRKRKARFMRTRLKGDNMARRKSGHRRSGGKNILMKGILGSKIPFGILGLVAAGFVYSKFVSPMLPKVIPMQSALTESAVIGGLPMAAGSFLANGIGGTNTNNNDW